jgi:hypothetical protein
MTFFEPIRNEALNYWALQTGREILDEDGNLLLNDSFVNAYECDWQNKYSNGHVNLFCSLGDWASNLTDLLKDNRFDEFDLDNSEQAIVLFRFYTRIMLIISELLTDFQDIYLHTINLHPSRQNNPTARGFYFPNESPDRISKILNFINSICKHKTQHIHICNDHLQLHFEDSSQRKSRTLNYLSLYDFSHQNKNGILIPKLNFLIRAVLICYRRLNAYFNQNNTNFTSLCQRYS